MMEDPGWHSGAGQTAMGQGVGKMGDRIIAHDGATFINRSYVKDAFNRLKGDVGDDVANALMSVVQKIEQSNNKRLVRSLTSSPPASSPRSLAKCNRAILRSMGYGHILRFRPKLAIAALVGSATRARCEPPFNLPAAPAVGIFLLDAAA
jgi:hypothetical protein